MGGARRVRAGTVPAERRGAIDRFAYLPFGAGRACIGSGFSLQEAMIVLATWSAGRGWTWSRVTVRPLHRVTLRPQGGLPMRLTRRG